MFSRWTELPVWSALAWGAFRTHEAIGNHGWNSAAWGYAPDSWEEYRRTMANALDNRLMAATAIQGTIALILGLDWSVFRYPGAWLQAAPGGWGMLTNAVKLLMLGVWILLLANAGAWKSSGLRETGRSRDR